MKEHDIIIIGAGPAGISTAIEAVKNNLATLLIDQGNVVNSIINFPVNMTFFSTPDLLEIADIPFNSSGYRPTRYEAVKYYHRLVSYYGIPFYPNSKVTTVKKDKSGFSVIIENNGLQQMEKSKIAVIATGFYDNPNYLDVPGEELAHVSHYYTEALKHFGEDVVIVGGKNSAVEAALDLYRNGAKVSIIHRRNEIKESVKYWILPDIINRINEGSIKAHFNAKVKKIEKKYLEYEQTGEVFKIHADSVYLLTGYHPNEKLLLNSGIKYDKKSLVPQIYANTLESNVPGIYLCGSIVAGRNANKIFIENSREHGKIIVSDIVKKLN